jgi:uncharacterized protein (TIGR00251 family)
MPGNIFLLLSSGVNMPSFIDAISETKIGTTITIEVTAGARQDIFPAGFNAWRKTIGCHVTARAVGGRANRAVVSIIAQTLDLPERAVQIEGGTKSQIKRVLIVGIDKPELILRLKGRIPS